MGNEIAKEFDHFLERKILELFEEGLKELETQYQKVTNEKEQEETIARINIPPLSNNLTREQRKKMAQYEREKKNKFIYLFIYLFNAKRQFIDTL
jgi:hypothetical protein